MGDVASMRRAGRAYLSRKPKSFGRGGGNSSSGNTVSVGGQGYSVAPELQQKFIKDIGGSRRGGSGGGRITTTPTPTTIKTIETPKSGRLSTTGSSPVSVSIGGQGYSVAPGLKEKFIRDMSVGRGTRTPGVLEVQPAPTKKEIYKRYTDREGYVKGTLSYFGGGVTSLIGRGQTIAVKKYGGKYDPYTAELAGKTAAIAPYFTPYTGAAILVAGGAEELGTKSGRERIGKQSEYFESKGWSPTLAASASWGLPIAEAGLGVAASGVIKGSGFFRTLGREEVPLSDLTSSEVLTGAKSFPTAPSKIHLPSFEKTGKGYHATSEPWKELTTSMGRSELPGTYISTQVSPYFLRAGAKEGQKFSFLDYFYGDVIAGVSKPGVMEIVPEGFRKGAYSKIPGTSKKDIGYKWTSKEKYGVAEVPAMKTEIEAILRPGTQLKKVSSKYYFKYQGQRIPIDVFKVTGSGKNVLGVGKGKGKSIASYEGSYGGIGSRARPRGSGKYSIVSSFSKSSISPIYLKSSGFLNGSSSGSSGLGSSTKGFYSPSYNKVITSPYKISPPTSYKKPSSGFMEGGTHAPTKPVGIILPKFSQQIKKQKQVVKGFTPQAKTKGGKWRNLSKKSMTREAALGRMAYAVDNSTSAQGRIKKSNGALSMKKNDYFNKTSKKFRAYRKVKGKAVKLHNQFIEKRGTRIDTVGEKRGLSLSKLTKNMGWLKTTKKNKIKKKKK